MAGTTMAAAKAALFDLIGAVLDGQGVQVSYGDPGSTARKELVWLGDVEDSDDEPTGLKAGRRRRQEVYVIKVWIETAKASKPQLTEVRACEIAEFIETALADDPKINATPGLLFAVVRSMSMTTDNSDTESRTRVSLDVSVTARKL